MSVKKRRPAAKKKDIELAISKLEVYDVPIAMLEGDEDNPNEMDQETFDMLVEEIRENGFDEPILIRPHPTIEGKFQISSGHHRVKASKVLELESVPAIIKSLDDRKQKVALVKRNILRGDFNKAKLAAIYKELSKGRDPVQVQRELGASKAKKFEAMIDQAKKSMTPAQRKKLDAAKEDIKSMDDLSSVLNRIFKESGSELDKGYMVFSFGGKKHHYFQIGEETEKQLQAIIKFCEANDIAYTAFMEAAVQGADLQSIASNLQKSKKSDTTKKKPRRRPKK